MRRRALPPRGRAATALPSHCPDLASRHLQGPSRRRLRRGAFPLRPPARLQDEVVSVVVLALRASWLAMRACVCRVHRRRVSACTRAENVGAQVGLTIGMAAQVEV